MLLLPASFPLGNHTLRLKSLEKQPCQARPLTLASGHLLSIYEPGRAITSVALGASRVQSFSSSPESRDLNPGLLGPRCGPNWGAMLSICTATPVAAPMPGALPCPKAGVGSTPGKHQSSCLRAPGSHFQRPGAARFPLSKGAGAQRLQ